MRRSTTVTGPAPPDEVWTRYTIPARWPSWSPQIRAVDYAGDTLASGTAGVVRGPCTLAVPFEILQVEAENRCWVWRVNPSLVGELTLRHAVVPAGTGTRTTVDIDGPAAVVLPYLPLATLALRRLVRPTRP